MIAIDILKQAIEGWETKGWIQHRARNEVGATCSSGGIEAAALRLNLGQYRSHEEAVEQAKTYEQALRAFREAIENRIGNPSIITWNDAPGRTVEDVILTAKRAIEALEVEGENEPTL